MQWFGRFGLNVYRDWSVRHWAGRTALWVLVRSTRGTPPSSVRRARRTRTASTRSLTHSCADAHPTERHRLLPHWAVHQRIKPNCAFADKAVRLAVETLRACEFGSARLSSAPIARVCRTPHAQVRERESRQHRCRSSHCTVYESDSPRTRKPHPISDRHQARPTAVCAEPCVRPAPLTNKTTSTPVPSPFHQLRISAHAHSQEPQCVHHLSRRVDLYSTVAHARYQRRRCTVGYTVEYAIAPYSTESTP